MNSEMRAFIEESRKRLNELERMVSKVESYPCVKVSKHTGSVILFTANETGIKINESAGDWFGDNCYGNSGWDENAFTIFSGTVTYKNGQPVKTEREES